MRPADPGSGLCAGVGALRGDVESVSRQFGRNLAEARGWEGISQKQLAERVSLNQSEVARLEYAERCPRLDKVVKLADALGVQVRDLLYGIE
ncbi:MAG: helix-turn-helix transcriptional regulator [Actinobacteria bacterium]|nr:MAG: helix-turn-helix transcriptional regulator [Actinomycetota bacterium]